MRTLRLTRDAVHIGNLILVNRDHPHRDTGQTLAPVDAGNSQVLLLPRCAVLFTKLMDELSAWEQIKAVSGWRTQEEQEQLYSDSLAKNGPEFTAQYVAIPGHSEHQTGLALDLALNQPNIDAIRPHFSYTGICGAFRDKAINYGFIERYPKGKEEITGIAHEPWHFRYVGAPHARIMREMGVALEEYLQRLKEFPYGGKPFRYDFDGLAIEISYLEACADNTLFELESDLPYSVSGDNGNGFIVTVWRGRR